MVEPNPNRYTLYQSCHFPSLHTHYQILKVYPQSGTGLFALTSIFSIHLLIFCHYIFPHINLLSWNASNFPFRSVTYPSSSSSKPTSTTKPPMVIKDRCNLIFLWTIKACSACATHLARLCFPFRCIISYPPKDSRVLKKDYSLLKEKKKFKEALFTFF